MSTESIGTRKTASTSPLFSIAELALADEFLFARMQALMSLAIVLASEGLATNCTNKWPLVGVGTKVGS